jgi:hypothetical protein
MQQNLSSSHIGNRIVFQNLSLPHLAHGVFNRWGGVSKGPWSSLNAAYTVGDSILDVKHNRQLIKDALGVERLISARQIHGAKVHVVEKMPAADVEVDGCDALLTTVAGIGLLIQHADCQAILLHDPVLKVAGIVHAGWRGSVANIIASTITNMVDVFGTHPADVLAAISPSLGPCCAEFVNYEKELPTAFNRFQVRPAYFDFWQISLQQLQMAGLRPAHISLAGECTVCQPDYFSYRREKITGRCASVIGLIQ